MSRVASLLRHWTLSRGGGVVVTMAVWCSKRYSTAALHRSTAQAEHHVKRQGGAGGGVDESEEGVDKSGVGEFVNIVTIVIAVALSLYNDG